MPYKVRIRKAPPPLPPIVPPLVAPLTYSQVRALLDLHACVLRGGDARDIAASDDVIAVVRKFIKLRIEHEQVVGK